MHTLVLLDTGCAWQEFQISEGRCMCVCVCVCKTADASIDAIICSSCSERNGDVIKKVIRRTDFKALKYHAILTLIELIHCVQLKIIIFVFITLPHSAKPR